MYELELKARVGSASHAISALEQSGCDFGPDVHQVDRIFARDCREITSPHPGTIVLRIRVEADDALTLNLKQHQTSELDCIEHEVRIAAAEPAAAILGLLGLAECARVDKVRRHGRLGSYTVNVDEVVDLGAFVELELLSATPPTEADHEALRVRMIALAVDVRELVHIGYDRMLLQKSSTTG